MKKFLIVFGTFILFIISTATLFKLQHWPGAGPLFVFGMSFFAAIFLPIFFIERMLQNKTALNIITNIFGLISTNILFVGVLFKIMHWPGASAMIVLGTMFFIFPTLILYVVQQFKEYDRKFGEFWRTVTMGILASVFLIFWGINVSRNIIFSYLKVEDATLETNKNLSEYNDFILNEIKQKSASNAVYSFEAENIHKQTLELIQYIEEVKKQLIQYVESDPNAVENHWYINAKDNFDIPTHYLGTDESQEGDKLLSKLNRYKITLLYQLQKLHFENKDVVRNFGDFGIKTELKPEMMEGNNMKWNEGMFYQQTVVGTLALLSGIQNEVLNAEFKSLKVISMNMK